LEKKKGEREADRKNNHNNKIKRKDRSKRDIEIKIPCLKE
jgi:hypothetical protein